MMIPLRGVCRRFETGRLLFSRGSRRNACGIGICQHSIIINNKAEKNCRRPLSSSYLSKHPYCDYGEVCHEERHWKLGGDNDAHLTLLMDLGRFCVDVELCGKDRYCGFYLGREPDSLAHYNRLLLRIKGFVKHGSAGVYDVIDSYEDGLFRLSKTGLVFTHYRNDYTDEMIEIDRDETTRLLSRIEMKYLLLLDEQEVQKSIAEFRDEIRDAALSFVARGGVSLGDAVTRYDDTGSLNAWETIGDAMEDESEEEELIKRFGFEPDDIFARMELLENSSSLDKDI